MELGASALTFLMSTWEGHLTPPEAANMADKASKSLDAAMVRSGAALALSVLPHAAALNQNEIQRAIQQCKEQRNEMLEKACEAVENAANGGGVIPEVLFEVARHWHDLFEKHQPTEEQQQQQPNRPPQEVHQQPLLPNLLPEVANPQQNVLLSVAGNAAVTTSNFPHSSLQVGLPFPVYSIVPGFPTNQLANAALANAALTNANASPLMFVTPPPAAAAAAALQLQAAAANTAAAAVYPPPVSAAANNLNNGSAGNPPRFGQIYQLGLAAPLLPAPPPTTPYQAAHQATAAAVHHHAALLAQQQVIKTSKNVTESYILRGF